jgi:hypothetical protein
MTTSKVPAEAARQTLKELLEKNGDPLLEDRDRCEGLLKDHCGAHRKEISALIGALEERIPSELKSSWQTSMTPEAMRARLVQRLEDNRGLAPEVAAWAVDAWSYALGISVSRQSDRVEDLAAADGIAPAGASRTPTSQAPGTRAADRLHGDRIPPRGAGKPAGAHISGKTAALGGLGLVAATLACVFAFTAGPRIYRQIFHKPPSVIPNPNPPTPNPPAPNPPTPNPNDIEGNGGQNGPSGPSGPSGSGSQSAGGQAPRTEANGGTQSHSGGGVHLGAPVNDGHAVNPFLPNANKGGQPAQSGNLNAAPANANAAPPQPPKTPLLAAGSPVVVRLSQNIDSDNLSVGEIIPAALVQPLTHNGNVVAPSGASAELRVTSVDPSGKVSGRSRMELQLADLTIGGKRFRTHTGARSFEGPAQAVKAAERTGIGAGAGAVAGFITGKLFHHGKAGAATGAAAGGVAGAATTKPSPVKVSAETVIEFRLTQPLG